MNEIIINKFNLNKEVNKLVTYLINQNKNIMNYNYCGLDLLNHKKLALPFANIKNIDFKYTDRDATMLKYQNDQYIKNGLVITCIQYMNNKSEYIKIKESNLYQIIGMNKKTLIIEHHKQLFHDDELLNLFILEVEKVLKERNLYEKKDNDLKFSKNVYE